MASATKKHQLKLERLEMRDCPTAGALDPGFGNAGVALVDLNPEHDIAQSMAIQPDGKTVVAGYSLRPASGNKPANNDFALMRFNLDGTLDASFGTGGKVLTDFQNGSIDNPYSVAVRSDGKIVVAGKSDIVNLFSVTSKLAVARFNANGTRDTSFDGDGMVTTSLGNGVGLNYASMVLQPDGKIVVGTSGGQSGQSNTNFALARYNANGSLDQSFDGDGKVYSRITSDSGGGVRSLAIQSDGRIVAAGYSGTKAAVARYNTNGSLHTSFGTGGHVELTGVSWWTGLALQSGQIVVVGNTTSPSHPVIARYTSAGALDQTFGTNGSVIETSQPFLGYYWGVDIQGDGKIVVAGGTGTKSSTGHPSDAFNVARYSANGVLDPSFGDDGIVVTAPLSGPGALNIARGIAVQDDGKIVVAGISHDGSSNEQYSVVRYLGDDPMSIIPETAGGKSSNDVPLDQTESNFGDFSFSLPFMTSPNFNAGLDSYNDDRFDVTDFSRFSARFFTMLP